MQERRRFAVNEVVGRRGLHEYRLASRDAAVVLRHNHVDAHVLHEVFRDPFYTPPQPVHRLLAELPSPPRVIDLGGNIGCFGVLALTLYPGAEVVAFEPEPSNIEVLKRCIARNGLEDRWHVVEACAGVAAGETPFVSGEAALSRMPLRDSPDAPTITVPIVDVFPYLEEADLLKMDIEGAEWRLLADPRFEGVAPRAILLEWHSYDCPEDNPRRAATQRLTALGYNVQHEKPVPEPDSEPLWGAGTLWAWRGATG